MTFEQIKELIDLVTERQLQGVEIERSGFRLRIEGKEAPQASGRVTFVSPAEGLPAVPSIPEPVAVAAEPAPEAAPEEPVEQHHVVTSPIVGTFYAASSPEAEPYVRVGDRVKRGQVLCIVEAMKLMNEIECDADGVVVEILPKNAQPVEFGEPLFAIKAD